MANVRIKDLPLNTPIPASWVVAEVMTTPGVFTTSKASLSTLVNQGGQNYIVWQSTTSTVTGLSATWSGTTASVNASAGRWNSTYATVSSLSANWSAAYNSILSYKEYWDLGYTLGSSSYTTVRTNSAGWQAAGQVGVSTYTTVNAYSASWNAGGGGAGSVYLTVNGLSGAWTSTTRAVTSLSSRWDGAFTSVYPNSGNWNSAYTLLNTTTATTFLVNNLSARSQVFATNIQVQDLSARSQVFATNIQVQASPSNGIAWADRNNSGYANQWYRSNSTAFLFDNSPGAPNSGNLISITSAGDMTVAGNIDTQGKPISGCPTTAKAWVNFSGLVAGAWSGGVSRVSRTAGSNLATVTTTSPHNLINGNRIWVLTGVAAGSYSVTVLTPTTFTITTTATTVLTNVIITFQVSTVNGYYNVNSVTKSTAGAYRVNFNTPIELGYSINGTASNDASNACWLEVNEVVSAGGAPTTTSVGVRAIAWNGSGVVAQDSGQVSVTIFGN